MDFDLDQRTASLSIGEFASFSVGVPREPADASATGAAGLWRARLGTRWHQELRATAASSTPGAAFEVPINGQVFHRGWTLTLAGRIDQFLPPAPNVGPTAPAILREIKTTLATLPLPEEDLRRDHPDYFAQLATYLALRRIADPAEKVRGELVFVEAASGLVQTLAFTTADEAPFRAQLDRVAEFLDLRLRARERLRSLQFRSPFTELRPGQQTTQADLATALAQHPRILFTAPTGFGKTGALLECALTAMRSGRFSRLIYLTSKATGQLQVLRTLRAMTSSPARELEYHPPTAAAPAATDSVPSSLASATPPTPNPVCHVLSDKPSELTPPQATTPPPIRHSSFDIRHSATPVAAWQVRPKHEHCLDPVCYCQRREFNHPDSVAQRWQRAGLSRFYLFDNHPRDLDTLRAAGLEAQICPYEITRAALAFQDVWIGDFNYVFAPANRGLFYHQPGFAPAETLLVIDEAHNLPARAADARSHTLQADAARRVLADLEYVRAPSKLLRAWETYALLLASTAPCEALDLDVEDDLADTLRRLSEELVNHPLDLDELDLSVREQLWNIPVLADWFSQPFPRLVWSPRDGELRLTCLDAAQPTGEILRDYGAVIFATATPGPVDAFAESVGVAGDGLHHVAAHTPWRDAAYDIAYDTRVDTTYQQRARHAPTTADTIATLHAAASSAAPASTTIGHWSLSIGHSTAPRAVAVFFPSYAYAESIAAALDQRHPHLRVALQPRLSDLAAQSAWVDESLAFSDALFLVLGSSFAEGIDTLGGRISHAMVVGPALPEVNAVQRARVAALSGLSREESFRRVYQIPGIQKVNQALGRLVRAPGQRAKVILHCRRFVEPAYASLLDRDYQFGATLATPADLAAWLGT